MNEQNLFNKMKFIVCFGLISSVMGVVGYSSIVPSLTSNRILPEEISNTGEIRFAESSEIRTGKTSIQSTTNNKETRSGNRENKSSGGEGKKPTFTIKLKGFATGDIRQEYANYAYNLGGENLLYLILCENGGLDLDLQSRVQQSYGRERSYGLCQLSLPRKGVDTNLFLTDYKYQLDTCWKYRKSGTPFYGPTRKVNGKACYIRASKQVLYLK